ncbi:neuropeptide CCHamide-2 receptor isoform X3 [Temnothorax americanus]|uniref:neuropeptide CCHamide-2 receptor isoform X3 n=1 Tax=Temnothorax americanus TaxID=1964332 RepID=UPI004068F2F5
MVIPGNVFNINASSIMEYEYDDYVPYSQRAETYIVPAIFSLILIVGVTGNGILVLILLCHTSMRNVPNTYVLSLALGDLLVIVTSVPFTSILYTIESWPWGLTICKLSECAKDISIGVSVFTLAALSAERYCAIVNPIRRHMAGLSAKPLTILTASLIWVLAIVLAMPAALFSYVSSIPLSGNHSILICNPFPEEFGMAWHLALSTKNIPGELPSGNLHVEQIKARRRVGKMVVCFIIVFVICFLPYHIFMLWFHFCPTARDDYDDYWHVFRIIGFCLSFSNSCINPIALYLISRTFRRRFNNYLCFCLPSGSAICGRNRMESSTIRKHGAFSQRSRRMFYETSFGSTFRRRTQEFNSTGVFERASILDTTNSRPTVGDRELLSYINISLRSIIHFAKGPNCRIFCTFFTYFLFMWLNCIPIKMTRYI